MKRPASTKNKRNELRRSMAANSARFSEGGAESADKLLAEKLAPTIPFRKTPIWKRIPDILLSVVLLVVLAPLLLATALYIRIVSPGPVLYVQERVGAAGRKFRMYKFRTMAVSKRVNRDEEHRKYVAGLAKNNAVLQKPDHAQLFIRGGNFLRSSSLDELPQLFNVLKGEMSLVGPRPDLLQLEDYESEQLRRFEVLPGITGLWQVNDKNDLSFGEMIDLDIHYVDHRSPTMDLKILCRTALTMVGNSNS